MSVEIPWTRIASASAPRPLLFSGNQEGTLGGPELPLPRMGDRFALDVRTAQLRQDADSRLLVALLTEGSTADVRMLLNQPNVTRSPGTYGAVVDGAGQSGSILDLRGMQRQASIAHGQFFSIVHASVHFVYMATATRIAGSDGKMTLPIWPMLRFLTVDGERCAIDDAMIEGKLTGFQTRGATYVRNRVEPLEFSIVERA